MSVTTGVTDRQGQSGLGLEAQRKAVAVRFAANVAPVIRDIEGAGVTTLQGIADALNASGTRRRSRTRWTGSGSKE